MSWAIRVVRYAFLNVKTACILLLDQFSVHFLIFILGNNGIYMFLSSLFMHYILSKTVLISLIKLLYMVLVWQFIAISRKKKNQKSKQFSYFVKIASAYMENLEETIHKAMNTRDYMVKV